MAKEIAKIAAENIDFISSAEEIWKNENEIKYQIVNNLAFELGSMIPPDGYEFRITKGDGKTLGQDDTGFGFGEANKPYWIYFYFRYNFNDLEVGIDWIDNPKEKPDFIKECIRKYFIDFKCNDPLINEDWIWGCKFKEWSDMESWADKFSEMPKAILAKASEFSEVLKSLKY